MASRTVARIVKLPIIFEIVSIQIKWSTMVQYGLNLNEMVQIGNFLSATKDHATPEFPPSPSQFNQLTYACSKAFPVVSLAYLLNIHTEAELLESTVCHAHIAAFDLPVTIQNHIQNVAHLKHTRIRYR